MKKLSVLLLAIVICFTFVGCSSSEPTSKTVWSYEKLTYKVTESGSNETGTLTLTAEKLNSGIDDYVIPVIKDGALSNETISLANDSHILEGVLEFGGDVMVYQTVTTSGFRPLYSYKALFIKDEQSEYSGEGDAPACLSYVLTTVYDKAESKATSSYLRRKSYSEEGWDGEFSADYWATYTKTYEELKSPFCDVNQIYYSLRALNEITTKDFTYRLNVPMALELTVKDLYCVSTPNGSISGASLPYVEEMYGADYSVSFTKVTITPQDSNVIGKGIEIFYAESGLSSREDFANATDGEDAQTHEKVPVLIRENIESTTDENLNGRGTITYSLIDFSTARP